MICFSAAEPYFEGFSGDKYSIGKNKYLIYLMFTCEVACQNEQREFYLEKSSKSES